MDTSKTAELLKCPLWRLEERLRKAKDMQSKIKGEALFHQRFEGHIPSNLSNELNRINSEVDRLTNWILPTKVSRSEHYKQQLESIGETRTINLLEPPRPSWTRSNLPSD